jgi:uncharacterized protein (TIGR03000 family)
VAVAYQPAPAAGGNGGYAAASPDTTPSTKAEQEAVRDLLKKLRNKSDESRWNAPAPARVTVRLPADARLYVNGVACPLTSDTRSFVTPRLRPGQRYAYTLRAEVRREGRTVAETRRVNVAAGRRVRVNFDFSPQLTATSR